MNELDRQIQDMENWLDRSILEARETLMQTGIDEIMYGSSYTHIELENGEPNIQRIDPRTVVTGERPNIQMMDEAGHIPDREWSNQMSIQRNTTTITGSGIENQITYYGTGGETEVTERDFREAMESLYRNTNNTQSTNWTMITGEQDMREVERAMRDAASNYGYTSSGSSFATRTWVTGVDSYDLGDNITYTDSYTSYKGNKFSTSGPDSSTLIITTKGKKISIPNNRAVYNELLLQAKLEKYIGINGVKWTNK